MERMVINFLSTLESSYPYIMAVYTQDILNEEKWESSRLNKNPEGKDILCRDTR